MSFIFPPTPVISLPVHGTDARFALRRIFCVGRNYGDHIREMGFVPEREPPFFFTKPIDAIVEDAAEIAYPLLTQNFHHEAELVIAIGKDGRNIAVEQALEHVFGYATGNDLTRRDLQLQLRDRGRPWDWSKAFDQSAVCGTIYPVQGSALLAPETRIRLWVNEELRQNATVADMIWSVPEIIAHLSSSVEIRPGDLVYTGTPAGVGPLVPGDFCVVEIDSLGRVMNRIGERQP